MRFEQNQNDDGRIDITLEGHEREYLTSAMTYYVIDAAIVGGDQLPSTHLYIHLLRHEHRQGKTFNRLSKRQVDGLAELMSQAKIVIPPEEAEEYGNFIGQLQLAAKAMAKQEEDLTVEQFRSTLPDTLEDT